jgi:putative transposase
MKRLNMGYARYFNEKYKRSGALFEGRYKSISLKNEAHFIHLPYYIHLNSLDLKFPEWRDRELKNYQEAMKFLESYRWSSFPDYIGEKNFPSVTQRDFLLEFFEGPEQYKKDTIKWLKEIDLEEIKDLTLE